MLKVPALVISLPHRQDRRDAFKAAWDKAKLDGVLLAQFIPGLVVPQTVKPPFRVALCDMACAVSHRRAVAMAAAKGWDRVLVLEDDAVPCVDGSVLAEFLSLTLSETRVEWDTVNLGGCSAQWRPATPRLRSADLPDSSKLYRVRGMVTTHTILYSWRAYESVLASVPDDHEFATLANSVTTARPYDQWLGSHGTMLTGTLPLFTQSGSDSDIIGVPHHTSVAEQITKTYQELNHAASLRRKPDANTLA